LFKPNSFYSWVLGLLAIVSLIASVWVVYKLDPLANSGSVAIFYCCSGIFILSISALILFFFRQRFGTREMVKQHLKTSLRQGFWVALLYLAALILQSQGLFSWLNSAFLVIALTFLEVYFLYNERKSGTN
jgi:hypothetical protein